MSDIPVIVVDDDEIDRYVIKRRLQASQGFGPLSEAEDGDEFLDRFFTGSGGIAEDQPALILMDINMLGLNGFETIEELQHRLAKDSRPRSVVILMYTTSDYAADRERANQLPLVKGYLVKPLENEDIEKIRATYHANGPLAAGPGE
ncbi:MAG: response regulator [Lysobacterales bacterium]